MFIEVPTKPYTDQKPGTSGLRKKVKVFQQENYTANFVQSTFNALRSQGSGIPEILVIGGDGRYYLQEAIQIILKVAAGNGVKKAWVGCQGLMSTPAVSTVIRRRLLQESQSRGAFILTASHNPGGPTADFGLKYNAGNGGPAAEKLTSAIYTETLKVSALKFDPSVSQLVDITKPSTQTFGSGFTVDVIDPLEDYVNYMKDIFDFNAIRALLQRPGFDMHVDCLHGISGPYVQAILHECLNVPMSQLHNTIPLSDFGGGHPDPNLTYAKNLVDAMGLCVDGSINNDMLLPHVPAIGAAFDGDADRNMILGNRFFVNPSDSLAILAANADSVPFFKNAGGLKAVARSMPTSGALDRVAATKKLQLFEVPTGWKFFGNLMDSKDLFGGNDYNPLICGEESFGTGSNHIREKDGLWAFLFWLSVLADRNTNGNPTEPISYGVKQVVETHWSRYGRNYYSRYDYEDVTAESANSVIDTVLAKEPASIPTLRGHKCIRIDNFEYSDPVDGSLSTKQGVRVLFEDGSRFVLRLSGTGSSGATIRLYLEQYMDVDAVNCHLKNDSLPPANEALKELIELALEVSGIPAQTGREVPTVIT